MEQVYLDNSATSFPKPPGVLEFAHEFYASHGINVGRGKGEGAIKGKNLLEETRSMLTSHFSMDYPDRVILTASASLALNQIIFGMKEIQTVYYTPFEHNSILRPLFRLKELNPLMNLIKIPFLKETFSVDWITLEQKMEDAPPDLVCSTQASNVIGLIPPIPDIIELAKEFNPDALTVVDGVQCAGTTPPNLKKTEIDYYVFSGHKSFFAGYGVAGWVMSEAGEERLEPFLFGGTGTVSEQVTMPNFSPSRFEVGSHNIWAIASLYSALKWLSGKKPAKLAEKTKILGRKLVESLRSIGGIKLFLPQDDEWYPILSFIYMDRNSNEIGDELAYKGIAVRSGFHCAPLAHQWIGSTKNSGTVRLSPGPFNTEEEISYVRDTLVEILS